MAVRSNLERLTIVTKKSEWRLLHLACSTCDTSTTVSKWHLKSLFEKSKFHNRSIYVSSDSMFVPNKTWDNLWRREIQKATYCTKKVELELSWSRGLIGQLDKPVFASFSAFQLGVLQWNLSGKVAHNTQNSLTSPDLRELHAPWLDVLYCTIPDLK